MSSSVPRTRSVRRDAKVVLLYRGAEVKAMAICTRHPFIQVFKVIIFRIFIQRFESNSS